MARLSARLAGLAPEFSGLDARVTGHGRPSELPIAAVRRMTATEMVRHPNTWTYAVTLRDNALVVNSADDLEVHDGSSEIGRYVSRFLALAARSLQANRRVIGKVRTYVNLEHKMSGIEEDGDQIGYTMVDFGMFPINQLTARSNAYRDSVVSHDIWMNLGRDAGAFGYTSHSTAYPVEITEMLVNFYDINVAGEGSKRARDPKPVKQPSEKKPRLGRVKTNVTMYNEDKPEWMRMVTDVAEIDCGPACCVKALEPIAKGIKKKDRVIVDGYGPAKSLNTLTKFFGAARRLFGGEVDLTNSRCLAQVLATAGIGLKVWRLEDIALAGELVEPIFESHSDSCHYVNLCWKASPAEDGVASLLGHFMMVNFTPEAPCPDCGVKFRRPDKRGHICGWKCEWCQKWKKGSQQVHERSCKPALAAQQVKLNKSVIDALDCEEKKIEVAEDADTITLAKWRAAVESGRNTCLLGEAGTGKSTAVRELVMSLQRDTVKWPKGSIYILAEQGIAVDQYPGLICTTVHSFLGWNPATEYERVEDTILHQKWGKRRDRIKAVKLLIVDEIGSIPPLLLQRLDNIMRNVLNKVDGTPFGGVQFIGVGDWGQRQPFKFDGESVRTPLYRTKQWAEIAPAHFVLHIQKRTSVEMDAFLAARREVYHGRAKPDTLLYLNSKLAGPEIFSDETVRHLTYTNERSWYLNQECFRRLFPADSHHYYMPRWHKMAKDATESAIQRREARIKSWTPESFDGSELVRVFRQMEEGYCRIIDPVLMLAVGCRAIVTMNQFELDSKGQKTHKCLFPNGCEVVVTGLYEDGVEIERESNAAIKMTMRYARLPNINGFSFLPLKLGYSRTIYKSQGATMEKVCLWPDATERTSAVGLIYVAMTRVRDPNNFFLGRALVESDVICDRDALEYTKLVELHNSIPHVLHELNKRRPWEEAAYDDSSVYNRTRYLGVTKKQVKPPGKGSKLNFYTRQEIKAHMDELDEPDAELEDPDNHLRKLDPRYKLLNNVLFFDMEWAPKRREGTDLFVDTVYSIAARYWRFEKPENKIFGFDEVTGELKPNCLRSFTGWIMEICQAHVKGSAGKRNKNDRAGRGPITLIAYNGCRADFDHVLRELLHSKLPENWFINLGATRPGNTVIGTKIMFRPEGKKEFCVMQFWDPFQWLVPLSLGGAHEAFGSWKEKRKGVFPHNWIAQVGIEQAMLDQDQEVPIDAGFPSKMRKDVLSMLKTGELKSGSTSGSVLFNCHSEHHRYIWMDVDLLEDVVEGMQKKVWDVLLPGHNLSIFKISTGASFAQYTMQATCPRQFKIGESIYDDARESKAMPEEETKKQTRKRFADGRMSCRLQRPMTRHGRYIYDSSYAGMTLPRRLNFRSKNRHQVLTWIDEATGKSVPLDQPCIERYECIEPENCLIYADVAGMYHQLLMENDYPLEACEELWPEKWPQDSESIGSLLKQWRENPAESPLFMAKCDAYPSRHNCEPLLPHRDEEGRLRWNCEPKMQTWYTSVDLEILLDSWGRFENVSHVLVYGSYKKGRWSRHAGKIFKEIGDICFDLRTKGDASKTFGKNIINSLNGSMSLKVERTMKATYYVDGAMSPGAVALDIAMKDPELRLMRMNTYFAGDEAPVLVATDVVSEEEDNAVMDSDVVLDAPVMEQILIERYREERPMHVCCEFEIIRNEQKGFKEKGYTTRCPQVSAFVYSYSRLLIHKAINAMLGENRYNRNGCMESGIYYSDTDSMIVSGNLAQFLPLTIIKLGSYSDDLYDYYPAGRDRTKGVGKVPRIGENGSVVWEVPDNLPEDGVPRCKDGVTPMWAKVIFAWFPQKKVYCLQFVTPDGRVMWAKTKTKGICRDDMIVRSWDEDHGHTDVDLSSSFVESLSGPRMMEVKGSGTGATVFRISSKRMGAVVSVREAEAGLRSFDTHRRIMGRMFLAPESCGHPPERVLIPGSDGLSIPAGFEDPHEGCDCLRCERMTF